MKERPILFSAPMVKAILAGNKTMTRRVMNPQPVNMPEGAYIDPYNKRYDRFTAWTQENKMLLSCGGNIKNTAHWKCQYGIPGDLLWVRETTCIAPKRFATPDETCIPDNDGDLRYVSFKADGHSEDAMRDYKLRWTPSIHVPKWAVRIWLKVISVRVEYLNAITREDIIKEGACTEFDQSFMDPWITLWDSINGKPKPDKPDVSWNANPWVWVVEFEKTTKPTDL